MPSTSDSQRQIWLDRQEALIASLKVQPLLLVVRPERTDLQNADGESPLLHQLRTLHDAGLRHLELAWIDHPGWPRLVERLRRFCPEFSLGAASVVRLQGLEQASHLGLNYAMAPCWDPLLQRRARFLAMPLVPGVFSPSEVHQAIQHEARLVKLFPAANLGCSYWSRLEAPLGGLPFVIAAGGLSLGDVTSWLASGHGAVALGRRAIGPEGVDPALLQWLQQSTTGH